MASTQQQQEQQDNWFASIEQEVLQKQQQQQQPTRRTAPTTPSTFIASAPLSANSGAAPRPPSLDHNRDDYFARQSCVNSGAQTRNAPQQKDPTYQQRLMAMIPDTSSISLNSLSLSNVIPASVPNIQNIFGRSTSPTKQMESSAAPATGFGNSSSSYHSPSKLASNSPERSSFLSSSSNPSSNVASAYPSSNSMLTSTYNSTKAAVASFSSGFSSDSATSSSSLYAPVGSSGKVSQAYQGQTSLLSSTKAAVSKLAQTVTSATMGVSSSKSLPTRSSGAYGLGGGSNYGGQRDSSSTLYDRGVTPTTISSWSKANDSWGGFADDDGEKSLFMSGAEVGGRLGLGSVGAGAGASLHPW
ncbi:hypothetical protein HDU80_010504 [Chytriomyces hyalinus]|nr:hypothetical protein HDU80_010504 [Chytriomyces hyalinus]